MMVALVTFVRRRLVSTVLLAAGFVAATALTASAAPASGSVSLSGAQVITSGVGQPPSAGAMGPLMVATNAGETVFQGSTVVHLAVQGQPVQSASIRALSVVPTSSAQSPQKVTSKGPLGIAWMLWVALLAIFMAIVGAVVALVAPAYVSGSQRRVESIAGYTSSRPVQEDERSVVNAISTKLISLGDKVMDTRPSRPHTEILLERADLPLRVGEWAVLRAVAMVVGASGGVFLMHAGSMVTFVGFCLGALVGVVLPLLFLKFAASHRAKKSEAQLPDVLTLVASSLSTGFSLLQALDSIARDADEPSAKEFSRALAETRIGADLNESLDHLADRMDSKNMRWTGMAIDIQRQVGGNLAETLRNTVATLRERQALSRHVKALAAEGKLSAYILIALPFGLFFYMLIANRKYVALLWTDPIGMGMSAGGLIAMAVGIFWMSKVVKVEV